MANRQQRRAAQRNQTKPTNKGGQMNPSQVRITQEHFAQMAADAPTTSCLLCGGTVFTQALILKRLSPLQVPPKGVFAAQEAGHHCLTCDALLVNQGVDMLASMSKETVSVPATAGNQLQKIVVWQKQHKLYLARRYSDATGFIDLAASPDLMFLCNILKGYLEEVSKLMGKWITPEIIGRDLSEHDTETLTKMLAVGGAHGQD